MRLYITKNLNAYQQIADLRVTKSQKSGSFCSFFSRGFFFADLHKNKVLSMGPKKTKFDYISRNPVFFLAGNFVTLYAFAVQGPKLDNKKTMVL